MDKKFEERFEELEKKIPDDVHAKIGELANKQTEKQDYSKKSFIVWSQIIATLSIAVVGGLFTINNSNEQNLNRKNQTDEQEKNNKVMVATQLMSNREKSETEFRQAMFLPLINQVLADSLPLEKRFAVLQIFQNNFNDLFNSRALFDILWHKASESLKFNKAHNKDTMHIKKIMNDMIELARYTNDKQEEEIIASLRHRGRLTRDSIISFTFYDYDDDKKDTNDVRTEDVKISLDTEVVEEEMNNYAMKIKMEVRLYDSTKKLTDSTFEEFHISYFNTPLTDNFVLPDGDRIAVILKELYSSDSALIDVIHFPADYVTVGYRPSIEKVNDFLRK